MLSVLFKRRDEPHTLAVSMTGVKMADRVAFIGSSNGTRTAAIAAKVGLSGRAVAIVPDEASAERVRQGAAKVGVLVESDVAEPWQLPLNDESIDLVVIDDGDDLLGRLSGEHRAGTFREAARALRAGGRAIVIGSTPGGGLSGLLSSKKPGDSFTGSGGAARALEEHGFKSVRLLAERERLVFVEGMKPRAAVRPT
jgi:SAM-dependent methyltransferase